MNPVIAAEGLSRTFTVPLEKSQGWWKTLLGATRTIHALEDITFSVAGGEKVVLWGRNGSGKSTLIKLLTGVIAPSGGRVRVLGHTPSERRRAFLRRVGVMFGQKSLVNMLLQPPTWAEVGGWVAGGAVWSLLLAWAVGTLTRSGWRRFTGHGV